MSQRADKDDLAFVQLTANFREYARKLQTLGFTEAADIINERGLATAQRWLALSRSHLRDAKHALKGPSKRSAYSRAYYAAYSASKAVRYASTGWVSLTGDDHKKAPDLPDGFPDKDKWAAAITKLYEHRLRADYDNWRGQPPFDLKTEKAIAIADEFVRVAALFFRSKYQKSE